MRLLSLKTFFALLLLVSAATAAAATNGASDDSSTSSATTITTATTAETSNKLYQAFDFIRGFLFYKPTEITTSPKQGLTVIGAGFARTGTKSTETALLQLGHKIYDTRSMLEYSHQIPLWIQGAKEWKEHNNLTIIDGLLTEIEQAGYTATLDFPINLFAAAFAELRPNAKVLMTVRDTEEKWWTSWRNINFLLSPLICRPWRWLVGDLSFPAIILKILEGIDWKQPEYPTDIDRPLPWFEEVRNLYLEEEDSKEWIQMHKNFQKRLQNKLPKSRFLVFNVKDGWTPLLSFLEIDDPKLADQEFPNVNDINTLKVVRKAMDVTAMGAPLFFVYLVKLLVGRRFQQKAALKKKLQ